MGWVHFWCWFGILEGVVLYNIYWGQFGRAMSSRHFPSNPNRNVADFLADVPTITYIGLLAYVLMSFSALLSAFSIVFVWDELGGHDIPEFQILFFAWSMLPLPFICAFLCKLLMYYQEVRKHKRILEVSFRHWCATHPEKRKVWPEIFSVSDKLDAVERIIHKLNKAVQLGNVCCDEHIRRLVAILHDVSYDFAKMQNLEKYHLLKDEENIGFGQYRIIDLCNKEVKQANTFYEAVRDGMAEWCGNHEEHVKEFHRLAQKFPIFPFLRNTDGISMDGGYNSVEYEKAKAQCGFEWKEAHPTPVSALLGSVLAFIHAVLCLCVWGSSVVFFVVFCSFVVLFCWHYVPSIRIVWSWCVEYESTRIRTDSDDEQG